MDLTLPLHLTFGLAAVGGVVGFVGRLNAQFVDASHISRQLLPGSILSGAIYGASIGLGTGMFIEAFSDREPEVIHYECDLTAPTENGLVLCTPK